jgi:spore maturation protein CgeB
VSIRTFEIPACKGFMLHIDNDEIRTVYDVGREIDVFATPAELAKKIEYYLANPSKRGAMVESAYTRCVPAYSYRSRAEAILSAVSAKATQAKA